MERKSEKEEEREREREKFCLRNPTKYQPNR